MANMQKKAFYQAIVCSAAKRLEMSSLSLHQNSNHPMKLFSHLVYNILVHRERERDRDIFLN
jgi:hypothetical protein